MYENIVNYSLVDFLNLSMSAKRKAKPHTMTRKKLCRMTASHQVNQFREIFRTALTDHSTYLETPILWQITFFCNRSLKINFISDFCSSCLRPKEWIKNEIINALSCRNQYFKKPLNQTLENNFQVKMKKGFEPFSTSFVDT